MTDNRFSEDQDGRFFGREDWRFLVAGSDRRFPSPGVDTRFSGSVPWGSPASFFEGAAGAWFDPSDITTLYQDSAGATPVTAAGQPVGRMLDKSGNENHATQPTGLKRPTYQTGGGLAWLHFDGTQSMSTGSIDFSGSDQMSFFAGVRKLSDAMVTAILAELSTSYSTNAGSFIMNAPRTADIEFRATMGGTSKPEVQTQDAAYNAPVSAVMTAVSDISAMHLELRMNGAVAQTSAVTQGTGNYGNYPLYIAARTNSSSFFNGYLYGMVVIGRQPDAAEVQSVESYLAAKTDVII